MSGFTFFASADPDCPQGCPVALFDEYAQRVPLPIRPPESRLFRINRNGKFYSQVCGHGFFDQLARTVARAVHLEKKKKDK